MNHSTRSTLLFTILFLFCLGIPALQAEWWDDGIPVCTAVDDQEDPKITTDDDGGAIIAWLDDRVPVAGRDIYAQRIGPDGSVLWVADGVEVYAGPDNADDVEICSDGTGGAYISWTDDRTGRYTYIQRLDESGTPQWVANGIAVSTKDISVSDILLTKDGADGAIVVWKNMEWPSRVLMAQRVDPSGTLMWSDSAVVVFEGPEDIYEKAITTDGSNGAIVTWMDYRSGSRYELYAQRIDEDGDTLWTGEGVLISSLATWDPAISPDGSGGAFIVWTTSSDLHIQHINSSGSFLLGASGIPLTTGSVQPTAVQLTYDGDGGVIITWADYSSGNYDVYALRMDGAGSLLWPLVEICSVEGNQFEQVAILDSEGNTIVAWYDFRTGLYPDIYAQKIDQLGSVEWSAGGVPLCTADYNQRFPDIVLADHDGAIVCWEDERTGLNIYASYIGPNGFVGIYPAPRISAVVDVPGDQGGKIHVQWDASFLEAPPDMTITYYSVWRRLPQYMAALEGIGNTSGENVSEDNGFEETVFFDGSELVPDKEEDRRILRTDAGGYSWELLGTQTSHYFENYTMTVESLYDSTALGTGWQFYMVTAHTDTAWVYYDSVVDSGYSVDNLAPAAPLGVMAEQGYQPEGLTLSWDLNSEEDLSGYKVYRGSDPGFVPGPGNLMAYTETGAVFDGDWRWNETWYYRIVAIDIHGNESDNVFLGPADITGDDLPDVPETAFLAQNCPNPFNPVTTIRFGLKESGLVSLKVYDAAGRLIRVLMDEVKEAGYCEKAWNGIDDRGARVASGVYFYRLIAGDFVETKKMIMLR
ncbi:MAG: T9SS type A sorting domain-containing protein [Bacteroidales bacterium]|nr:T9SS type A sorting domain-containing protein [Candidatus Latescibacterota bacterium]